MSVQPVSSLLLSVIYPIEKHNVISYFFPNEKSTLSTSSVI
jgi:hypothetical protein